jgi:glycosyltransferase involved in cell wall biosynthesis
MLHEVLMPFYGDVEHFKYAVRSVLAQTDPDWTLTIIDDVYPSDEPSLFVEELNDSRITYFRNSENLGVSKNFQKCVDSAKADFITIMGCDDALLPGYVERVKEVIAQNPELAYIQPGVVVIDEENNKYLPLGDKVKLSLKESFSPPTTASGEQLATSLLKGCWTYFPSIAWNTSVLSNNSFRPEFRIVLDLALQLEIITGGGAIFIDEKATFAYRRHRKSVSMESALDGSRFVEEHTLFSEIAVKTKNLGWTKASRAAQLHITSRFNAVTELPRALFTGHFAGAGRLLRHIFGK